MQIVLHPKKIIKLYNVLTHAFSFQSVEPFFTMSTKLIVANNLPGGQEDGALQRQQSGEHQGGALHRDQEGGGNRDEEDSRAPQTRQAVPVPLIHKEQTLLGHCCPAPRCGRRGMLPGPGR